MLKHWSKRKRILLVGIVPLLVVAALLVALLPWGVSSLSISSECNLSIEAKVALAAEAGTLGNGEPISQEMAETIFSRGGPPIVSISYEDGIHIDCSYPYAGLDFTLKQIQQWTKNRTIAEAEAIITEEAQKFFEIWIDMGDFPVDDPAMQDPPELLDNERIERKQGRDWLVTTIAYFAIHCYNLNFGSGDFITRINGLEAGPIEGEWWP